MARCTYSSDDVVIKSPNDRRLYRLIKLDNGLSALLVHDPEIYPNGPPQHSHSEPEEDGEEEGDDEDEEEEDGEEEEVSEGDDDEEDDEEEEDGELKKKRKGSASQTKKVCFYDIKIENLQLPM